MNDLAKDMVGWDECVSIRWGSLDKEIMGKLVKSMQQCNDREIGHGSMFEWIKLFELIMECIQADGKNLW